jgi:hypothetical protein
LTPELRERLDVATRPGEGVAEAARRLLTVALDPVLPGALALASAAWDHGAWDDGAADRAEAARRLLAELDGAPGSEPR